MQKIGIVGVPSSAGARKTGQEQAPQAYRNANLIERLYSAGLSVTDFATYLKLHFNLMNSIQNLKFQSILPY